MKLVGGVMSASADSVLNDAVVYVVDDDDDLRDALCSLLRSVGLSVRTFRSSQEFLASPREHVAACLVLDVRLRGESGLEFQKTLQQYDYALPIVFMTAHGDVTMCVTAMKAGAVDFLTKPFRDQDMLDAVDRALAQARIRLETVRSFETLQGRYELLTPRERDVMAMVVSGLINKQIAANIGLSEVTVKVHRAQMMRKMAVRCVPDLVRLADALGISTTSAPATGLGRKIPI